MSIKDKILLAAVFVKVVIKSIFISNDKPARINQGKE